MLGWAHLPSRDRLLARLAAVLTKLLLIAAVKVAVAVDVFSAWVRLLLTVVVTTCYTCIVVTVRAFCTPVHTPSHAGTTVPQCYGLFTAPTRQDKTVLSRLNPVSMSQRQRCAHNGDATNRLVSSASAMWISRSKDDAESQWKNMKFDPPSENSGTDGYQNWQ